VGLEFLGLEAAVARKARHWSEVLLYTEGRASQRTVLTAFLKWREENGLPLRRCDNGECCFFSEPLVWNGKPLTPILDHKYGVNSDNRPLSLRLLCPNCDAQLETRGGRNRGRVEKSSGGYAVKKDGSRAYVLPTEPGTYTLTGGPVGLNNS
jgi:hypothetical protein